MNLFGWYRGGSFVLRPCFVGAKDFFCGFLKSSGDVCVQDEQPLRHSTTAAPPLAQGRLELDRPSCGRLRSSSMFKPSLWGVAKQLRGQSTGGLPTPPSATLTPPLAQGRLELNRLLVGSCVVALGTCHYQRTTGKKDKIKK